MTEPLAQSPNITVATLQSLSRNICLSRAKTSALGVTVGNRNRVEMPNDSLLSTGGPAVLGDIP